MNTYDIGWSAGCDVEFFPLSSRRNSKPPYPAPSTDGGTEESG